MLVKRCFKFEERFAFDDYFLGIAGKNRNDHAYTRADDFVDGWGTLDVVHAVVVPVVVLVIFYHHGVGRAFLYFCSDFYYDSLFLFVFFRFFMFLVLFVVLWESVTMTNLVDDGAGDGVILVPACNGMQLANKRMAQVRNAGVFIIFVLVVHC